MSPVSPLSSFFHHLSWQTALNGSRGLPDQRPLQRLCSLYSLYNSILRTARYSSNLQPETQ